MKEELRYIYNKAIKPLVRTLTNPFIIASSWGRINYLKDDSEEDLEKLCIEAAIGSSLGAVGTSASLCVGIKNFVNGNIQTGLLLSIPLLTNLVSGGYELWRWAKYKVREDSNGEGYNLLVQRLQKESEKGQKSNRLEEKASTPEVITLTKKQLKKVERRALHRYHDLGERAYTVKEREKELFEGTGIPREIIREEISKIKFSRFNYP